ncbi:MAG: hypothetical protein DRJ15_03125 [Bacteroidetes bacterium]|nr:MAG: hypothetical protein DRJ15_03125 [Bacteroidota bacterium]
MNISHLFKQHPFRVILVLAVIIRLVAVIFSKGFGWFDDHFLIIEASQSWVDGYDYNRWLPGSEGNTGPGGHNFFYAGLHFIIFKFFSYIGFTDPQGKMYVVRLLHAALSLAVVVLGYRITLKLSGQKGANIAGLLLALLWLFPFISVRNLIEFTCVPFLLWGSWILMDKEKKRKLLLNGFLAGLVLGIAFCMRFQSMVYIGGIGLGLMLLGRWKEAFGTGFGVIVSAFLFMGSIDIFIWGYPFAELIEYINYNMYNYAEYTVGPWYQYILVLLLLTVPPVSFFLIFGYFYGFIKDWKKYILIFLPVMLFLIFHSYYPNKQERFILPIVPFIIIAGTAGWLSFQEQSKFWLKRKMLNSILWGFFWLINISFLLVISTTYSKRARVESMTYLSKYPKIDNILVENSNKAGINLLPMYYLDQWVGYSEITNTKNAAAAKQWYIDYQINPPDFMIFEGENNLDVRLEEALEEFPGMVYETTISPGMIDRILFWLNPINENQNAYIYRNTYTRPKKIE